MLASNNPASPRITVSLWPASGTKRPPAKSIFYNVLASGPFPITRLICSQSTLGASLALLLMFSLLPLFLKIQSNILLQAVLQFLGFSI